jgi:hypothetical protein
MLRLVRELKWSANPVALAASMGVDCDPWQANVLTDLAAGRLNRTLILAPRQSGKSTTTALAATWFALVKAPAHIVLVAPSAARSNLMLSTIGRLLSKLPGGPTFDLESEKRIQLSNSSLIRALHGDERTLRGHASVHFLALDEAESIKDSLISGVSPMLVNVGGTWFAIGTPRGQVGWWADMWSSPDKDETWTRIRVDVNQCPRLTPEELQKQKNALGPTIFRQEFMMEWIADSEQAFDPVAITNAFKNEVEPLWQ